MFSKSQLYFILITCAVSLLICLSFLAGFFDLWQEKTRDRFFTKSPVEANIIIIGIDNKSLDDIGQWPWPRVIFAEALSKLQKTKITGIDIHFSEASRLGAKDDMAFAEALNSSAVPVILPLELRGNDHVAVEPLSIYKKSTSQGFVNVSLDADGVARKIETRRSNFESFASLLSNSSSSDTIRTNTRISYNGPRATFLTFSFSDLISNKIPDKILLGSTVLIGTTAGSLHDDIGTPFGTMPGVEVHANIIQTIRTKTFFHESSKTLGFLLIFLGSVLALFIIYIFKRFSTLLFSLFGTLIVLIILPLVLFLYHIIIPHLYILLSFIVTSACLILLSYVNESKEKRFIRKTFQYYLMPEIIEEIMKDPKKLSLGGERKKITIFFSDIRGFTTLSEKMSPEDITNLMNEYLTGMTNIIMENRGLVDKYIGDAIMAFWGAPISNGHQEEDASRTVLEMLNKLKVLNTDWQSRGLPHINIGIGINTGEVIVGNIGSEKRFNYTIMGDEVNFASRLEGLTKVYGVQCIVSESTKNVLKKNVNVLLRELDQVIVKGKKEPRKIFELISHPIDDSFKKILEHFDVGRMHYNRGEWNEAKKYFETALTFGVDGPSTVFLMRCVSLIKNPPPEWTGVYEFNTK